MTYRPISRPNPMMKAPFCATPAHAVRLASHRSGQGKLLIIWLGADVAAKIGLCQHRHTVTLMIDEDRKPDIWIGIKHDNNGEFRAARRGQSYAVYIDKATAARLIGDRYAYDIVASDSVELSPGMVAFPLLTRGLMK